MTELIDKITLKQLEPASGLNRENFQELASKTYVESLPAGRVLFKEGDLDKNKVYVIEGKVELV